MALYDPIPPDGDFDAEGPFNFPEAQEWLENIPVHKPADGPTSLRFRWIIRNFSRITWEPSEFGPKLLRSKTFSVGAFEWNLMVSPKENDAARLSLYLQLASCLTLDCEWSIFSQFRLTLVNQLKPQDSIRKDAKHQFNSGADEQWGFPSFVAFEELCDPTRGFLVDDNCIFEAEIAVHRVTNYWSRWSLYSKKETGFVGLKNHTAIRYMNPLIQTLYHLPYFRKAVYHMQTSENDVPSALQRLFYNLQYGDTSVATEELAKSFGSFMQHDVHEINRLLYVKLEESFFSHDSQSTIVREIMQLLFDVRTETRLFHGLQLEVHDCWNVYDSFDKFVEADPGFRFTAFPPVLQLQLKRFGYDSMYDTMEKINDRYEFPLQLDLDRENGKYLSPLASRSVRNLYTLHSVIVHRGGVLTGHCYAYIRPTLEDQWFKFDDERVTKEDMEDALEEQYGGLEEIWVPEDMKRRFNSSVKFTKSSSACILVYIRESEKEMIMCNVDEKDSEQLRLRMEKEREENEQKREAEAASRLYTVIKVARTEDLLQQIGHEMCFDLVDFDHVGSICIPKQMPFSHVKEEVAKKFGIPVQFQRLWIWAMRQNRTFRPYRPLTLQEEAQTVGQLRDFTHKAHDTELRLFLEVQLGQDLRPVPPPEKTNKDILLFFKLYDPLEEQLRYVGMLFVKKDGRPSEILTKLNEMANFNPDEEIELYEEIRFEPIVMVEFIDKKLTFRDCELKDGDILWFQKRPPVGSVRYPDVPSFLENMCQKRDGKRVKT